MNLDAQLAELEKTALIRRIQATEATWLFHQSLTQESVYRSLLRQTRREMHLAVARAYEQVYSDQLDDYASLLAEHYAAAQDDAKTFEYSTRAGHAAMRVYAHAEVIAHFTRALETAQRLGTVDSASLKDSYLYLGRALEMSGRFGEATQNYEEMETTAHQRDDRAMQLGALIALATIHSTATVIADEAHARTLSNLALGLAREIGDRETEARVLWNLMLLSSSIGEMQQAVDYGEESLVISRELGMDEQTAYTLNDLFRPYNSLGQSERARIAADQAREYFRAFGNQAMLADNLGRSTIAHVVYGDFDLALELAAEARQIGETIGNPWSQSFSVMYSGHIQFHRGEMTRAIDTMEDCIRLAQVSGFLMPQIWTRSDLGLVYGELGGVERGLEMASQALALARERFPRGASRIHGVLARLALLRGDVSQVESHVEQSKANPYGDFALQTFDQSPLVAIKIALAKGDYTRALELADPLLSSSAPIFMRVFQGELLYLKGVALFAQGNAQAAREAWRQALTEAEKIGSRWMRWQIHAALGEHEQAREIVGFIAQNTPDNPSTALGTSLRVSFLNLPAVREIMA